MTRCVALNGVPPARACLFGTVSSDHLFRFQLLAVHVKGNRFPADELLDPLFHGDCEKCAGLFAGKEAYVCRALRLVAAMERAQPAFLLKHADILPLYSHRSGFRRVLAVVSRKPVQTMLADFDAAQKAVPGTDSRLLWAAHRAKEFWVRRCGARGGSCVLGPVTHAC